MTKKKSKTTVKTNRPREQKSSSVRVSQSAKARSMIEKAIYVLPDIFYTLDLEGTCIYWNRSLANVSGYSNQRIFSMKLIDFICKQDRKIAQQMIRRTLTEGKSKVRANFVTKKGKLIPYEFINTTIKDSSGMVMGIVGSARDVTERTRIEKKTSLFFSALDRAPNGVILTDMKGRITYSNQCMTKLFQYSHTELRKLRFSGLVAKPRIASHIIREAVAMDGWTGEIACCKKKKASFLTILSLSVVRNEQGLPIAMLVIFGDLSEMLRQTKELKKHQELIDELVKERATEAKRQELNYQNLFADARDGIFILDVKTGKILESNNSFLRMIGYSKEEVLGKSFMKMGSIQDAKSLKNTFVEFQKKKHFQRAILPIITKEGCAIQAEYIISMCPIGGGTKVMRCDVRDVSERVATERTLKESELQLKTIFEKTRDGFLIADTETRRFVVCNRAICAMLGYTEDELKKLSVDEIHPEPELPAILRRFKSEAKGVFVPSKALQMKRKDGSIFYADVSASLLRLNGRKYLLGSFRDVTESRHLEEIKDNFMNVVSHELRTPLSVIKESFALILDGITGPITNQ